MGNIMRVLAEDFYTYLGIAVAVLGWVMILARVWFKIADWLEDRRVR